MKLTRRFHKKQIVGAKFARRSCKLNTRGRGVLYLIVPAKHKSDRISTSLIFRLPDATDMFISRINNNDITQIC